jgi:hypothetical protein
MNTSAIPIVNERHEFTFIEIINRAFWISGDDSFRISGDNNGIGADIAFEWLLATPQARRSP